MAEVFLILSYICAKEMLMCVPILLIVGYLIKHYTTLPNAYIPYIETGLGLLFGILYGGLVVGGFKNVVLYGGQGVVLGFISISLYDAVHGIVKHKCNLETKQMEEAKKKFNPWEHNAFCYTVAFLGGVVLAAIGQLIMYGVDGMVYYLVNNAVHSVYLVILVDVIFKIRADKKLLNWQYWVMDGFVLLAVWAYCVASLMTTWAMVWVFLIVSVAFLTGAGLWCQKMYKPAISKKAEDVFTNAVNYVIEKTGMTRPEAEELTNYFIVKK